MERERKVTEAADLFSQATPEKQEAILSFLRFLVSEQERDPVSSRPAEKKAQ